MLTKPGTQWGLRESDLPLPCTPCVSEGLKTTRAPRTISSCDWPEIDPPPFNTKKATCKKSRGWGTSRSAETTPILGRSRDRRPLSLQILTHTDTGLHQLWKAEELCWPGKRAGALSHSLWSPSWPSWDHPPNVCSAGKAREKDGQLSYLLYKIPHKMLHKIQHKLSFLPDNWPKDRSDFLCQAFNFCFHESSRNIMCFVAHLHCFDLLILNWSIVDLQCCVSFKRTATFYIYIHVYLNSLYILFPIYSFISYYNTLSRAPCATQ